MKEKVIKQLYDFWSKTDDDNTKLLEEITNNVNNGLDGAEVLLDWCRSDYDGIRSQYQILHNLSEDEMDRVMEENFGCYEFMYEEIPYAEKLDEIWDICNEYLDYCYEELEKLIETKEKELKYLNDEIKVCAYGKEELYEIMALENEIEDLKSKL